MINTFMALWNQKQRRRGATVLFTFLLICISISLLFVIVDDPQWLHVHRGGSTKIIANDASTTVATQPVYTTPAQMMTVIPTAPTATVVTQLCTTAATNGSTAHKAPLVAESTGVRKGTASHSSKSSTSSSSTKHHPTGKATPEVTPEPTATPTLLPTTPTPTPTRMPTLTPTTPTPTVTPSATTTPGISATATSTSTATATPVVSPTPSATVGTFTHFDGGGPVATIPVVPTASATAATGGPATPEATSTTGKQQKSSTGHVSNCLSNSIYTAHDADVLAILERSLRFILFGGLLGTVAFYGILAVVQRRIVMRRARH